jgi:hypothetical protein
MRARLGSKWPLEWPEARSRSTRAIRHFPRPPSLNARSSLLRTSAYTWALRFPPPDLRARSFLGPFQVTPRS